jgi:hypothetical protein
MAHHHATLDVEETTKRRFVRWYMLLYVIIIIIGMGGIISGIILLVKAANHPGHFTWYTGNCTTVDNMVYKYSTGKYISYRALWEVRSIFLLSN